MMNKLAQVPTHDSLDQVFNQAAHDNKLSSTEMLFLKKKVESEIRVKLAEFANEIVQARKLRERQ